MSVRLIMCNIQSLCHAHTGLHMQASTLIFLTIFTECHECSRVQTDTVFNIGDILSIYHASPWFSNARSRLGNNILAYFPKMKVGLSNRHSVCLSVPH
jgi:hypothetical protein